MQLDRSPGRAFDVILKNAISRARASAEEGKALLESGYPGPAYLWAVRSIEILFKEVMLLPLFLEEIPDGAPLRRPWAPASRSHRARLS